MHEQTQSSANHLLPIQTHVLATPMRSFVTVDFSVGIYPKSRLIPRRHSKGFKVWEEVLTLYRKGLS